MNKFALIEVWRKCLAPDLGKRSTNDNKKVQDAKVTRTDNLMMHGKIKGKRGDGGL